MSVDRTPSNRTKEERMAGMVAPLSADKLEDWESWIAELNGARRSEFEDMNRRHGLTDHRAYLQPLPDGGYAVLVIHEGPGGDEFMANVMASDHEFDRWFVGAVADVHGIDPSAGMPPPAERRL
jgi:hypothetical protein